MLALLAALAAAAQAPSADLRGVWEGNIGDLPVRACFDRRDWGAFGAYYYLSRRRLIALEPEEGEGGAFRETDARDPNNPRWTIESAGSTGLSARWEGGGRALPVRLRRVAGADGEDGPCTSPVFHQPRLEGVRTVASPASIDGVAYTRIALDHGGRFSASFETFALDGSSEAVRRINATLAEPRAGDLPEWFDCVRTALVHSPYEGDYNDSLAPTLISERWLNVAYQYDNFCGGNHPNHGRLYRVFDLADGEEVDLHDWLDETAVHREHLAEVDSDIAKLRPEFRDFILSGWRADPPECDDVVRSDEYWNIGLARDGLIFAPDLPHVAQFCTEEFTIAFERLRPYLSDLGARSVRALEAEDRP